MQTELLNIKNSSLKFKFYSLGERTGLSYRQLQTQKFEQNDIFHGEDVVFESTFPFPLYRRSWFLIRSALCLFLSELGCPFNLIVQLLNSQTSPDCHSTCWSSPLQIGTHACTTPTNSTPLIFCSKAVAFCAKLADSFYVCIRINEQPSVVALSTKSPECTVRIEQACTEPELHDR